MRVIAVLEMVVLGTLVLAGSCVLSMVLWGGPALTAPSVVVVALALVGLGSLRTRRAIRAWARGRGVEVLSFRQVCGDYLPCTEPIVMEFIVVVRDCTANKQSIRVRVSSYLLGFGRYAIAEGRAIELSPKTE